MEMRNRYRWLATASAAIVATVVTIVCFAAARSSAKRGVAVNPSVTAAERADVEGIVFAVQPTGFDPPDVSLAKGSYLFIVQNRSGIRDLTFQLDREAGGKLHEVHDQKLQWKKIFDLNPGSYVLTVVEHPEWRSVITVRPH
jgi:hypothetical protein